MPTQAQSGITPRRTALITGASSGIGLDLAWILAEHGYDLVLVARRLDILERLASEIGARYRVSVTSLQSDLRDPAAPMVLYDTLATKHIVVDVLINNAGIGLSGRFDQVDERVSLETIALNVSALTALTRLFLPAMVQRGHGRVMNVASTAAFQPGPLMAVYYATKAYVLSFTEAVAEELRDTGVTLTALCPGPTRTAFAAIAQMTNSHLFKSPLLMNSRDVAEYGYAAMLRGKRVAIPGPLNRLVAFSTRLAPRAMATTLSRWVQENH